MIKCSKPNFTWLKLTCLFQIYILNKNKYFFICSIWNLNMGPSYCREIKKVSFEINDKSIKLFPIWFSLCARAIYIKTDIFQSLNLQVRLGYNIFRMMVMDRSSHINIFFSTDFSFNLGQSVGKIIVSMYMFSNLKFPI